jgi:hypothetical protein
MLFTICVLVVACIGCGAEAPLPKAETAPVAHAQPSTTTPAPSLTPALLPGVWVEFWALSGHADTQRYALFEDGRFGWRAAAGSDTDIGWRWGRVKLNADGTEIVFSVEGEAKNFGCEPRATCRVIHQPALEQRLSVGACPENEEARALDAQYRCYSLGGQAFWRHSNEAPEPVNFLP